MEADVILLDTHLFSVTSQNYLSASFMTISVLMAVFRVKNANLLADLSCQLWWN